jgi:hypothetical protein
MGGGKGVDGGWLHIWPGSIGGMYGFLRMGGLGGDNSVASVV